MTDQPLRWGILGTGGIVRRWLPGFHSSGDTLAIVGSRDRQVIQLNHMAYDRLTGPKELVIIEGAGHLFEEPGTLEEVERQAARWFRYHLAGEEV